MWQHRCDFIVLTQKKYKSKTKSTERYQAKSTGKADAISKMATNRGNTPKRRRNTIAEELMALVSDEEYVEEVEGLTEDKYLTKTEVASIRKMISGKLWIDGRKFTNRQNQCIPTGMYELFRNCVSKSAVVVHTEVVN